MLEMPRIRDYSCNLLSMKAFPPATEEANRNLPILSSRGLSHPEAGPSDLKMTFQAPIALQVLSNWSPMPLFTFSSAKHYRGCGWVLFRVSTSSDVAHASKTPTRMKKLHFPRKHAFALLNLQLHSIAEVSVLKLYARGTRTSSSFVLKHSRQT